MENKKKASKSNLILGIVGSIISILNIIYASTRPDVTTFYQILSENLASIVLLAFVFIPIIIRNISAYTSSEE